MRPGTWGLQYSAVQADYKVQIERPGPSHADDPALGGYTYEIQDTQYISGDSDDNPDFSTFNTKFKVPGCCKQNNPALGGYTG